MDNKRWHGGTNGGGRASEKKGPTRGKKRLGGHLGGVVGAQKKQNTGPGSISRTGASNKPSNAYDTSNRCSTIRKNIIYYWNSDYHLNGNIPFDNHATITPPFIVKSAVNAASAIKAKSTVNATSALSIKPTGRATVPAKATSSGRSTPTARQGSTVNVRSLDKNGPIVNARPAVKDKSRGRGRPTVNATSKERCRSIANSPSTDRDTPTAGVTSTLKGDSSGKGKSTIRGAVNVNKRLSIMSPLASSSSETPPTEYKLENEQLRARIEETTNCLRLVREALQSDFECSICNTLLVEARALNCSHTFCTYCIWKWMHANHKDRCPLCRARITTQTELRDVDRYIDKMLTQLPGLQDERRPSIIKQRDMERERMGLDMVWAVRSCTGRGSSDSLGGSRGPRSTGGATSRRAAGNSERRVRATHERRLLGQRRA